ncbi:NusG domain II-containing protein [Azoarcus sp. PA01]|nr:NusG domain II-containing protein [Azoarcus sp. PA01]
MNPRLADWLALLRPGDFATLAGALAVCVVSALLLWRGGAPDKAIVRAGGAVFAELSLAQPQRVDVPGPLGITRIEVQPGRARVLSDPGPRQYCVRQGWLSRAGAVAICAPNEVSLSLSGGATDYDTLNY